MNHHLAIKTHARSCNLEHTERKHWLIHVTISEHSTFACLFAVKYPGGWTELDALRLQSWKSVPAGCTYLPPDWKPLFCPSRRKKSKESFSRTLWWSPRDGLSLWVIWYLLSSQVTSPLVLAVLSAAIWTPAHWSMDRKDQIGSVSWAAFWNDSPSWVLHSNLGSWSCY